MSADIIRLEIPAKPEYMVCLRLAASCAAERAGFDIEAIEDIKTAVAEAGLQLLQLTEDGILSAEFILTEGLRVSLDTKTGFALLVDSPEVEISAFLMEALMDSVEFIQQNGISKYLLTKKY